MRRTLTTDRLCALVACTVLACGGQSIADGDAPSTDGSGGSVAASGTDGTGARAGRAGAGGAAGTCPDSHTTCCDTQTGESSLPACYPGLPGGFCRPDLVKLEDAECRVVPDFQCPAEPIDTAPVSCSLAGAVCDYGVGCGSRGAECRCEELVPGVSAGTLAWVCTSQICARKR